MWRRVRRASTGCSTGVRRRCSRASHATPDSLDREQVRPRQGELFLTQPRLIPAPLLPQPPSPPCARPLLCTPPTAITTCVRGDALRYQQWRQAPAAPPPRTIATTTTLRVHLVLLVTATVFLARRINHPFAPLRRSSLSPQQHQRVGQRHRVDAGSDASRWIYPHR